MRSISTAVPRLAFLIGLALLAAASACTTPAAPPTPMATADMRPTATPSSTASKSSTPQVRSSPAATSENASTSTVVASMTATTLPSEFRESLVYQVVADDEVQQIWALQPGGRPRHLANGILPLGQPLAADGSRLVIDIRVSYALTPTPDSMAIFDLETGRTLPMSLLGHSRSGVFWSPDGRYLLYLVRQSDGDQLALHDLETGDDRVLAEAEWILQAAGWAPDSQVVTFIAKMNGQYDLYSLDISTLDMANLTNDTDIELMALWSPVSAQVLVGTVPYTEHAFESWPWGVDNLLLVDAVSGDRKSLGDYVLTSQSASWSPDGRLIAFSDRGKLCLKDVETLEDTCPLVDVAPYGDYYASHHQPPSWSADGKWLAFRAPLETCWDIVYFLNLKTYEVVDGDLQQCGTSPMYWSSAPSQGGP